jgi:hypothetical protein
MILRDFKHNVQTREIKVGEAWKILGWVLDCCRQHGVNEVTLIYGYDWEVGDKCWADQVVPVASVREHIKAEEERGRGCLGFDDVYIQIHGEVQVLFCHHSEVHLQYDQDDEPLARELEALLVEKVGLVQ